MSIAEAIASKRERLFEVMLATIDPTLETPDFAVKQFINGFISVLESAARGDDSTRDLYLAAVIPALREGTMPFSAIMSSMLRVTAAAACVLGPEHIHWVANYCGDYVTRLVKLWEQQ